jgi:hypothetical protein
MLSFYMDHHVHRAITVGLRTRGIDVITALEDGSHELPDESVFERTVALNRVLFTQDQDFLAIAARWQRSSRAFPGMVYAIQQRIDIGRTIEYLELIAHLKTADEMQNSIEFIPA